MSRWLRTWVSNDHDHHVNNKAHGLPRRPPCSPTWSLSTLHTAPGTQSGRSGKWISCASEGVYSLHWSCRHILCSSCKELHADHGKNEGDDGQHQGEVSQEPPLNCQWSWSACSVLAKILPTWKLGAKSKHKTHYQFLWKKFSMFPVLNFVPEFHSKILPLSS